MKVVITGGAGFIGSHLAEALSSMYQVTIIDNLSTGNLNNLEGLSVEVRIGEISDFELLKREFNGADCVLHQAAFISVPKSIRDPLTTNEINITGTLNILLAARDSGVKKVVFASSAAVYGDSPDLPKHESMLPNPLSPYAISKLAGEYYCHVFSKQYNLQTISFRYFNVYGPRQNPYSEYAAVIPKMITRLNSKKPPIIYGNGTQTRDFIFIQDLVSAVISAIKSDIVGVFNLASGRQTNINEIVRILSELMDIQIPPQFEPARPGDIQDSYADISQIKKYLKFNPRYTLREGLEETIRWFRGHMFVE
jgi:UDP-glucose 4-epimerase